MQASVIIHVLLLMAVGAQQNNDSPSVRIDPVTIPQSANRLEACPASDILQSAKNNITEAIEVALAVASQEPRTLLPACGEGEWRQVADLDMTDPSQQCPSPWVEVSTPARSCTSSIITAGCEGVSFPVSGGTYSRVCGRAVGYSILTPDSFADIFGLGNNNIDNPYLDGVSLTYGFPRQHIWSLGADHDGNSHCPCDNSNRLRAPLPPPFVGNNYFCDTLFNGALWDAMDCTTACCTFNSPPYFSVFLPTPTSDAIEARICRDEVRSSEATSVGVLQLFVQ